MSLEMGENCCSHEMACGACISTILLKVKCCTFHNLKMIFFKFSITKTPFDYEIKNDFVLQKYFVLPHCNREIALDYTLKKTLFFSF